MLLRLFLLFTLVPLFELFLLIRIGGLIGAAPTLLLVLATGAAGAWMARREGLRSWNAVQRELGEGRLPAEELLHSLLILVAGIVLVTPGVVTDLVGILLLVRPVRRTLIVRLRERFASSIRSGAVASDGGGFRMSWSGPSDSPWREGAGSDARDGGAGTREGPDVVLRRPREDARSGGDGSSDEARPDGAERRERRGRPRVIEL